MNKNSNEIINLCSDEEDVSTDTDIGEPPSKKAKVINTFTSDIGDFVPFRSSTSFSLSSDTYPSTSSATCSVIKNAAKICKKDDDTEAIENLNGNMNEKKVNVNEVLVEINNEEDTKGFSAPEDEIQEVDSEKNEKEGKEVNIKKSPEHKKEDVKESPIIPAVIDNIEILDSDDEENKTQAEEIQNKQTAKETEELTQEKIKEEDKEVKDSSSETEDDVSTDTDVCDPTCEKDIENLLNTFLEKATNSSSSTSQNTLIVNKSKNCKELYKKLVEYKFHQWYEIHTLLTDYVNNFKYSINDTIIAMGKVYSWLKEAHQDHLLSIDKEKINLTAEDKKWVMQVKRLQNLQDKLVVKIRQLEESEVNFDDEENSYYIQADYYKQRLKKVYEKLCMKLKENSRGGSMLFKSLNVNIASSDTLNKAINAHYRFHLNSPSFYQFNQFVRKIVKERNIEYVESNLSADITSCFKALCKKMAKRRQQDLYEVQRDFLDVKPDFNEEDESLKTKLNKHQSEGTRKLNEVFDKYANLQDNDSKNSIAENQDDEVIEDDTEDETKSSESDSSNNQDTE